MLTYIHGRVETEIVVDTILMNYLLIFRNGGNGLLAVHVYRGAARGLDDYYMAKGRVRVAERKKLIRGAVVGKMCIKVRVLRKKEKVLEYQKIRSGSERVGGWRGVG